MKNTWKIYCIAIVLVWSWLANAAPGGGVKVTGLDWVPQNERGRFVVITNGNGETPEWSTKGNRLSMTIPNAKLDKGIVRYVGGIRLAAANVSSGVLATLTFLNGGAIASENISITLNDRKIEVSTTVPAGFKTMQAATTPVVTTNTRKPAILKSDLGEAFLKRLETEEVPAAPVKIIGQSAAVNAEATKVANAATLKDEIKNAQAAPVRKGDNFSFAKYAGKFIAFLGVVLMFFWAVVQMMKKGVLSKGKLGFLNGSSLVSVISTTYIAPKRSLLLVKAHNQVFLVAASESGFEFLSEVNDVPGLVKEGERFITGENFDEVQNVENRAEQKQIKIKEDIYQSIAEEVKPIAKVNKDIARFSDELKKKVKNLKAMQ